MEDHIPGYVISDKIGEGGMGRIYRARQAATGLEVAVKVLAPANWEVRESRGRFLREAILLSTLRHPNICRLLDSGETTEGRYFFATELLAGETLQQKILREDLPVEEALEIGLQVAQGLAVAHRKGIVHRDVKPANLMIVPGGKVKILDFGLARLDIAAGVSMVGEVLGTPVYAAPEQLRAEASDPRVDIWALGVVLYEMVAGIVPFPGADARTIGRAVLTKEPVALRDWRPETPPELEAVIVKALAKDRNQRYDSAEKLASDLLEARRGFATAPGDTSRAAGSGARDGDSATEEPDRGLLARIRRWFG